MRRGIAFAIASFATLAFATPVQASLSGVTQPATNVTATSAKLLGSVDPSGSNPAYYFEYGLTSTYGAQTPAIAFSTRMTVSATIIGLVPGTTYHFRVVAKRDDRASRGADQTFTTPTSVITGIIDPITGLPVVGGNTGSTGTGSGTSDSASSGSSGSGTSGSATSGSGTTDSSNTGTTGRGDDGSKSGSGSNDSGSSGDGSGTGSSGEPGGDGSVVVTAESTAATAPVLGSTVGAAPDTGAIRVRAPGEDDFVPLNDGAPIPVGSTVDSRRGRVRIVTAVGHDGEVQAASFHGAVFKVRQRVSVSGLTDLVMRGGNFKACDSGKRLRGAGASVSAPRKITAARRRSARSARNRRPIRRLWGRDHHGSFRTHGRGSIATVRGTTWAVADYCDGTRTSVRSGAVLVHDKLRHRTVLVRAGHSYFARTSR